MTGLTMFIPILVLYVGYCLIAHTFGLILQVSILT